MKKYIILLFVIFSASIVNAQITNLGIDYEKIHGLFDAGDFENTVIGLDKLIPEVEKVYTDTSQYYEMNTMMGLSLLELKKYSRA